VSSANMSSRTRTLWVFLVVFVLVNIEKAGNWSTLYSHSLVVISESMVKHLR